MNAHQTNRFVKSFFETLKEVDPDFYATIEQDADRILKTADDKAKSSVNQPPHGSGRREKKHYI